MKVFRRAALLCGALAAAWLVLVLLFAPHLIELYRFLLHGQEYYSKVAAAADEVLVKAGSDFKRIRGDELQSLPPMLRDLKPEDVTVSSNGMILENGGTWDGIIVYWVPKEDDPSRWLLAIRHGESAAREVYSVVKPQARAR